MNRALLLGDSGCRISDPGRSSRRSGLVPRASGLVGRTEDPVGGAETRKAAGFESGGLKESAWLNLGGDGISALAVLALSRVDGEPHLLAQRPADEAPHAMGLPLAGGHDFLKC